MGKKKLDLNLNKIENSIDQGIHWLINSGIQNKKGSRSGSVNALVFLYKKTIIVIKYPLISEYIKEYFFLYKCAEYYLLNRLNLKYVLII